MKRFTDTDKWKKKWYRNLTNDEKAFWQFILDNCNIAGIWEVDFEFAQIFCGRLNETKIREVFKKQYEEITNGKKWFIKDFIPFQYRELKNNNPLHNAVILLLKKERILNRGYTGAVKGYNNPLSKGKGTCKGKGKELKTLDSTIDIMEIPEKLKVVWVDWIKYKIGRKQALKPMTIKKQLEFLSKQSDPVAVIEQSIRQGWQGLFPLKNSKGQVITESTYEPPDLTEVIHKRVEESKKQREQESKEKTNG